MEPIVSVSGLRGIVGESLTPHVASRYVAAFAAELPPGPIVVARDGRTSGPMLASIVEGVLCAMGRNVLSAGVASTPTVGVLVKSLAAAGGIQISASHNPLPYNGLKLFSSAGRVITAAAGQPVLNRYRREAISWAPYDRIGSVSPIRDTTAEHLRLVLAIADVPAIRARAFRVLLDANHGSGALLGAPLLAALGCHVVVCGAEPNGKFAHEPEPTAENLVSMGQRVVAERAAIGFCQDPDADRLAIIDEFGRYLGEEYTLALCVDHVLRHTSGPVVVNGSTSRMTADLAKKAGVASFRSAVGEANVVDEMLARQARFGGEGNGGPIDPRVGLVRDSFVGMALVLSAMAQRQRSVSELAAELPRYEIHKAKETLPREKLAPALDALERRFAGAAAERGDGLRLDWPDAWLQVRGSNTEPLVRIIAEATTLAAARALCDTAAQVLREV